jgi:hypothetical protein
MLVCVQNTTHICWSQDLYMHEYVYGQLSNSLVSKMSWPSFLLIIIQTLECVSLHSGKDGSQMIRKLRMFSGVVEGNSNITTKHELDMPYKGHLPRAVHSIYTQ